MGLETGSSGGGLQYYMGDLLLGIQGFKRFRDFEYRSIGVSWKPNTLLGIVDLRRVASPRKLAETSH